MYKVANKHRRQVRKTLHSLGKAVAKATESGHPVPELDLATLKVPGTDLFCTGNKGIPRIQMPQLKGFPLPGSIASQFKAAKSGKIDFSDVFLTRLHDAGLGIKRYQVNPTKLKSTQSQLQGSKIALQLRELEADAKHKKFTMDYFVSNDGYILDGHHGWATVLSYCLIHKKQVKLNVVEVDLPITELVVFAREFMDHYGLQTKDI